MPARRASLILVLVGTLVFLLVRVLQPAHGRAERESAAFVPHQAAAEPVRLSPSVLPEANPAPAAREPVAERLGAAAASLPEAPAANLRRVHVRVLDAWGAPVPALKLGLYGVSPAQERGPVLQRELCTDAQGHAWFEAGLVTQLADGDAFARARLEADLPLDERPALELDPRLCVPDELVLTLPPVGALVVHVLDPDGKPAERAFVEATFLRSGARLKGTSVDVIEGRARFPAVELGARIELRPSTPDLRSRGARLELDGPRAAGETVEATLRFDFEWPALVMRVLDENGRPLARTSLGLRILHGRLSPQPGQPVTEDGGELRFVVWGQPRSEDPRELLLWTQRPPRLVRLTLPVELGWPTDLGDVILRPTAPGNVPP